MEQDRNLLTLDFSLPVEYAAQLMAKRECHLEVLSKVGNSTGATDSGDADKSGSEFDVLKFTCGSLLPPRSAGKAMQFELKSLDEEGEYCESESNGFAYQGLDANIQAVKSDEETTVTKFDEPVNSSRSVLEVPDSWEDTHSPEYFELLKQRIDQQSEDLSTFIESDESTNKKLVPILIVDCNVMSKADWLSELRQFAVSGVDNPTSLCEFCEVHFANKAMFHSTMNSSKDDIIKLSAFFGPDIVFDTVMYPENAVINTSLGAACSAWKNILSKAEDQENELQFLKRLKSWIIHCSRSLSWKAQILNEIEDLVSLEEIAKLERAETVDRVNDLKELCSQIYSILEDADDDLHDDLQGRLRAVENSLADAENDLESIKNRPRFTDSSGSDPVSRFGNVLTAIFQRCESCIYKTESKEDFYSRLTQEKVLIEDEWKRHFGQLPG